MKLLVLAIFKFIKITFLFYLVQWFITGVLRNPWLPYNCNFVNLPSNYAFTALWLVFLRVIFYLFRSLRISKDQKSLKISDLKQLYHSSFLMRLTLFLNLSLVYILAPCSARGSTFGVITIMWLQLMNRTTSMFR